MMIIESVFENVLSVNGS